MNDVLFDRHRSEILHPRGISDELIDAVPNRYLSFEGGDWETFFRLMRFDTGRWTPEKVSAWKGKVTASGGGIVIARFNSDGAPVPPPYARLLNDVLFGDPARGAHPIHYAYRPGYSIKHIDIHPHQGTITNGSRSHALREQDAATTDVYFCLEGSLKADAVLSSGASTVMSSTSVTTWEGKDLKDILPLLRGARTVYVVPDSDFFASDKFEDRTTGVRYFNPSVLYFTRLAAQWLSNSGVTTKIAVPWASEAMTLGKLGVDDYLARGYALEDLTIEDPFPNSQHLWPAVKLTPSQERVLGWLLKHHGNRGAFKVGEIAKALRIHRDTVLEAYSRFVELRFMRVWQGFAYELDQDYRKRPTAYVMFELIHGYGDWLRSIRVPLPTRRKLKMDTWSNKGQGGILPPFAGPPGPFSLS
jgi:hypothetical protein